jgi:2-dehydro-3-deoxygluconokinase
VYKQALIDALIQAGEIDCYKKIGAACSDASSILDIHGNSLADKDFHIDCDLDWDDILSDADWFHFTGITPALSKEVAEITLEACKAAKEKGIVVSCDLNFRKKLWSNKEANETMSKLCKYVDICIANEEDAKDVFGIEAKDTDINTGKLNKEGYVSVAEQLCQRFNFKYVAITLRESISANDNNWSAMLYNAKEGKAYFSKKYAIHIVDRVGGGDSFGAGLIYALRNSYKDQDAIEFAVAASCLKHSIEGDYNLVSLEEVKALANGDASGRVKR